MFYFPSTPSLQHRKITFRLEAIEGEDADDLYAALERATALTGLDEALKDSYLAKLVDCSSGDELDLGEIQTAVDYINDTEGASATHQQPCARAARWLCWTGRMGGSGPPAPGVWYRCILTCLLPQCLQHIHMINILLRCDDDALVCSGSHTK